MAFITWNDSYSVNVLEFDGQHLKLLGMLNEIHAAMNQGKGKDIAGRIIDEMVDYTQTHFATEEYYFDKFHYPNAKEHLREHTNFVKRVLEMKQDAAAAKHGLSIEVMLFLKDWLLTHIKGSDKQYSAFFNEHGLK